MSNLNLVFIIVFGLIVLLAIGVALFSWIAERRNPPIGAFLESHGARLHYIERGNPAGTPVVMFHGNGSMIQDFLLSGLVDALAYVDSTGPHGYLADPVVGVSATSLSDMHLV